MKTEPYYFFKYIENPDSDIILKTYTLGSIEEFKKDFDPALENFEENFEHLFIPNEEPANLKTVIYKNQEMLVYLAGLLNNYDTIINESINQDNFLNKICTIIMESANNEATLSKAIHIIKEFGNKELLISVTKAKMVKEVAMQVNLENYESKWTMKIAKDLGEAIQEITGDIEEEDIEMENNNKRNRLRDIEEEDDFKRLDRYAVAVENKEESPIAARAVARAVAHNGVVSDFPIAIARPY